MNARPQALARTLLYLSFCFAVATLAVAADPLVHTVQKGDTLYAIARKYAVTVDAIKAANAIGDEGRLFVGLKLTIPGAGSSAQGVPALAPVAPAPAPAPAPTSVYTVSKGDTLYSIARAHAVSVDAIVKASGMKSTTIKVGQKLVIPGAGAAGAVVASTGTGSGASAASAAGAGPASTASRPVPAASAPAEAASLAGTWPVSGPVSYLQGKLKGVSIAAEPASPILAIRSGTVVSAGPFRGFDLVAFVQSGDGLVYVYGGAGSLSVRVGDSVRKGSLIGKVVSESEPAAYFFVFKGADTIDPNSVPRD